ncbi:hypothetical protein BKA93DRAFT_788962 [Sparassis latifolia]
MDCSQPAGPHCSLDSERYFPAGFDITLTLHVQWIRPFSPLHILQKGPVWIIKMPESIAGVTDPHAELSSVYPSRPLHFCNTRAHFYLPCGHGFWVIRYRKNYVFSTRPML